MPDAMDSDNSKTLITKGKPLPDTNRTVGLKQQQQQQQLLLL